MRPGYNKPRARARTQSIAYTKHWSAIDRETPAQNPTILDNSEGMATEKGLNLADLLGAPGLTSTLEQRLRAAETNGDGIISASEMIEVI